MEHGENADAGAEMLGIGGDGEHGLGRGLEQDAVDCGPVLVGYIGDLSRQREHDVEVRHRQQLGLALGEPFLGRRPLALRAVPVAAAVVGDDGVRTLLAACDMAAERCRAAVLDRTHDLHLVEADVPGVGSAPRRPMVAEDIRDLQRWTGHVRGLLGRRRVFRGLWGLPRLLARLRQQVEWAGDSGDQAGGDTRVARCRIQFVVTEQS